MNLEAQLTKRETQIAEFIAWGATKKDVANKLHISSRTVENTARSIYEKTEVTKSNELSAWWFCTHFNISINLSPLTRSVIASLLLILIGFGIAFDSHDIIRARRVKRTIKNEIELIIE